MGFPPVASDYWKHEEVLEAVGKRYPEMDMRPYGGEAPRKPQSTS